MLCKPLPPNPELDALLKRANEVQDAMTPAEKAIMFLRQKVSYVASEMTCDINDNVVRTREEADKLVSQSEPALILAEIDRLRAALREVIACDPAPPLAPQTAIADAALSSTTK